MFLLTPSCALRVFLLGVCKQQACVVHRVLLGYRFLFQGHPHHFGHFGFCFLDVDGAGRPMDVEASLDLKCVPPPRACIMALPLWIGRWSCRLFIWNGYSTPTDRVFRAMRVFFSAHGCSPFW